MIDRCRGHNVFFLYLIHVDVYDLVSGGIAQYRMTILWKQQATCTLTEHSFPYAPERNQSDTF